MDAKGPSLPIHGRSQASTPSFPGPESFCGLKAYQHVGTRPGKQRPSSREIVPARPCGEQGLRFRANIPKPTQGRGPRRQLRSPSSPKTLVRGVNCKACLFSLIQLGRCRRVRRVRCVYLFVFLFYDSSKNSGLAFQALSSCDRAVHRGICPGTKVAAHTPMLAPVDVKPAVQGRDGRL